MKKLELISIISVVLWLVCSVSLFVLRLCGVLSCSWWVATACFWAPLALVVSIVMLMSVAMYITMIVGIVTGRNDSINIDRSMLNDNETKNI